MIRIEFYIRNNDNTTSTLTINSEGKSYQTLQSLALSKNLENYGTFKIRYKHTVLETDANGDIAENNTVMRNTLTKIYINNRLKMIGVVILIKRTISVADGIYIDVSGADLQYCLTNYTTNISNLVDLTFNTLNANNLIQTLNDITFPASTISFDATLKLIAKLENNNLSNFIKTYTEDMFKNYIDKNYSQIFPGEQFKFSDQSTYQSRFDSDFVFIHESTRIKTVNTHTFSTFNTENYYSVVRKAVTPVINSLIFDTIDPYDIDNLGGIYFDLPPLTYNKYDFFGYIGQSIYDLDTIKNAFNIGGLNGLGGINGFVTVNSDKIESMTFESYNDDLASMYMLIPATFNFQTFIQDGTIFLDKDLVRDYGFKLLVVNTPATSLLDKSFTETDPMRKAEIEKKNAEISDNFKLGNLFLRNVITGVRNTFIVNMRVKDFYIKVGSILQFKHYNLTYRGVVDAVTDNYLVSNGFTTTIRISRVMKISNSII